MKKILFAFLVLTTPLMAVLPPAAQSKKEMETVLSSPELNELVPSGDVIEQLLKVPGGYMLITNKRIIPISVHYKKTKEIGPARFRLEFHNPILLQPQKRSWQED
jgi:hypothetical protein